MNFIKKITLSYRIKRAIKLAKALSSADNRKRLILVVAGVPRVYTKQDLKTLIAKRTFKKGITIETLEKMAITTVN